QNSGVRKVSMKVTSLWIRRTSKIFCRPRPSCRSHFERASASVHWSYSGPNWPRFQRSSMSLSSSIPSLYGLRRLRLVAIVPLWFIGKRAFLLFFLVLFFTRLGLGPQDVRRIDVSVHVVL